MTEALDFFFNPMLKLKPSSWHPLIELQKSYSLSDLACVEQGTHKQITYVVKTDQMTLIQVYTSIFFHCSKCCYVNFKYILVIKKK